MSHVAPWQRARVTGADLGSSRTSDALLELCGQDRLQHRGTARNANDLTDVSEKKHVASALRFHVHDETERNTYR